MDIFLPIAGMSFNFLVIVGIGGLVGFFPDFLESAVFF